ncbi:MAG TPA: glycosyltransferase [Stackebrandtia sp.]|jgi:glycosyltransferase involved in cell wall biosynthesis|uniref:glycosyltransferase n=1 Tax=Stackebrandtia sp. TaxID=2023065 RepID=UPI002D5E28ED|nr:glycosyltransferase [Stackebrandtia sp.]HZE41231.1 glycosyltransferase [Stackebrandtia sp.]
MKVTFLVHSLDRVGGITRATLTTASALAVRGHQVEIVSMFRQRPRPRFAVDPRVRLVALVDGVSPSGRRRTSRERRLEARASRIYPRGDTFYGNVYNGLIDERLAGFLAGCDAEVVIGTTPGINVYLSRLRPRAAVIAQEHMFYEHHEDSLRTELSVAYQRMDAIVTLTERDAEHHRRALPRLASRVECIPNSVPIPAEPPSRGDSRTIVAAGRLETPKNFMMLLDAFALVARRHRDWTLRIVGDGSMRDELRQRADALGLGARVWFPGEITPMDREWAGGEIAAVTSDFESFGLTIVEAMHAGLPVVSTACRYGPPEIITPGQDGMLSPVGDAAGFGAQLDRLIADTRLRRRLARAARRRARCFTPDEIIVDYEKLFTRLVEQRELAVSRA